MAIIRSRLEARTCKARHLQLAAHCARPGGVTLKWKNYRIKGRDRINTMTLDAAEFIRRFS